MPWLTQSVSAILQHGESVGLTPKIAKDWTTIPSCKIKSVGLSQYVRLAIRMYGEEHALLIPLGKKNKTQKIIAYDHA